MRIWIKRHRVLLLCLMSLQCVFLFVATTSFFKMLDRETVNPINFVRIEPGMTLKEVQAILGPEDRAYTTPSGTNVLWLNMHWYISVTFDLRNTVVSKTIEPSYVVKQNPLYFFIFYR